MFQFDYPWFLVLLILPFFVRFFIAPYKEQKEAAERGEVAIKNLYFKYKSLSSNFKEDYKRFMDASNNPLDKEILLSKDYQTIDDIYNPVILEDFLTWQFAS